MSSNTETLLDVLRSHTTVDCDTLSDEVAKQLGPFADCTSNQAIAYHELIREDLDGTVVHAQLIQDAVTYAKSKSSAWPDVDVAEVAVEAMMVKLALKIVPYLTGYSHIQTNPRYAYDKQKTIANAKRIVAIFHDLSPEYDVRRVCIKIPSTWEGLQACRELEGQGIATLATTLFCIEQAALASHAGCTYVAPYINELRVHFDPTYIDEHKQFDVAASIQRYFEKKGSKTKVLPASLTSLQDVMTLAGAHHITVSPPLLAKLADTPASGWGGDAGAAFRRDEKKEEEFADYAGIVEDEGAWRFAFTRSKGGGSEGKNVQAVNIFAEKQEGLEGLARGYL